MSTQDNRAGTSAVLSFVFNGLGQLYNGQLAKGLLIIFFSSVGMLIFLFGSVFIGLWLMQKTIFPGQLVGGIFLFLIGLVWICIVGIYSILDAYREASQK